MYMHVDRFKEAQHSKFEVLKSRVLIGILVLLIHGMLVLSTHINDNINTTNKKLEQRKTLFTMAIVISIFHLCLSTDPNSLTCLKNPQLIIYELLNIFLSKMRECILSICLTLAKLQLQCLCSQSRVFFSSLFRDCRRY